MCAISGLLRTDGENIDLPALQRISATMRNRGPDGRAAVSFGPCGLAHERLAIVDLEGGRQPLTGEDGRTATVVNGEIYNHQALRGVLEARGHRFATHSDSEVVVHGYEEFGVGIFERLHGMFAIAVWDGAMRTLVLARDGLGKKPLAYTWLDGATFAFASDVRAFHAHPAFRASLRLDALGEFLGYRCVADPGSIFEGVHKVPAGAWLAIRADGTQQRGTHWRLPSSEPGIPYDARHEAELGDQLRTQVSQAVQRRLMSDVPVGILLSGGIDSTIVAYEAARHSPGIHTFTLGFVGIDDECDVARQTANALGSHHSELHIALDPRQAMEEAEAAYDEPFADSSSVASVRICRAARERVGVVLNGDGGDEAFAGYPRARLLGESWTGAGGWPVQYAWKLRSKIGTTRSRARARETLRIHEARGRFTDDFERWRAMLWIFSPDEVARMTGTAPLRDWPERCSFADTEADDYTTYLRNDLLVKMDRASMHVGLEARSPLLDLDVVAFARRLDCGWKLRDGQTKYLLRKAYAGLLPPHVWHLRKRGFASPTRRWLRGELLADALELAADRGQPVYRFLDYKAVQDATGNMRGDHKKVWTVLTLNRWLLREAARHHG